MAPHPQKLTVSRRAWPLSRGTSVEVVVAEISDTDSRGRAECVPMPRFGESVESVVAQLEAMKGAVSSGLSRDTLQRAMPPGAARNALDCTFWDMDAKRAYCTVADLAKLAPPAAVTTAFTLDFDTPAAMAAQAAACGRPLLRLELDGEDDMERVQAVRAVAPAVRLIVDAQERWSAAQLADYLPILVDCRVGLIEQPLPAGADDALAGLGAPIPICADESCRTVADLAGLAGTYQAVCVKLNKMGGLTEAFAVVAEARRLGLRVMIGGGIGTSLGVAPALLVAQGADWVDLDGPLHLGIDRGSALRYEGGVIQPADGRLWGGAG
jgi:L-alanine-DL-glutamate epimerase-like enolase superfamily enzyme